MLPIKKIICRQLPSFSFFLASTLLTPCFLLLASPVHAQFVAPAAGVQQLQDLIVRFIALGSGFAFITLVIMLVYAGFRFLTSNGEPKNIQSAQQIVTWAVIGMACLVLSWIILLIIGQFTGLTSQLTHVCLSFDQCSQ